MSDPEPFIRLNSTDPSGSDSFDDNTPLSTPPSLTHDTTRSEFHVQDLERFAEDLQNAANRAFPNEGICPTRYTDVSVLLLRWEDDGMNVDWELEDLKKVFQNYGFETETWLIPRRNAHLRLMSKAIEMVEMHEDKEDLVIVYYAGHAYINAARGATWCCTSDPSYASLEWSAIQTLFEKAHFDVLLLLDCCAAASAAPTVGSAVTETIAACGFESIAPQPGRYSFTNTLIEVLEDWIDGPPFSAAMLHNKVLSVLKHERPERTQSGKRRRLECRRTPIHIVATADPTLPSIELGSRIRRREKSPSASLSPGLPEKSGSTTDDCESIGKSDQIPTLGRKGYQATSLDESTNEVYKVPRVIISLALEKNQALNSESCQKWLASCPTLVKFAKVEAVYNSFSALVLLSMPVFLWDMLPENPAYSFIGYTTSPNLHIPSSQNATVETMRNTSTQTDVSGDLVTFSKQEWADFNGRLHGSEGVGNSKAELQLSTPLDTPDDCISSAAPTLKCDKKTKRFRLGVKGNQILNEQFRKNPFPNLQEREVLSKLVGIEPRKIQVWFQNRRAIMPRAKADKAQQVTSLHFYENTDDDYGYWSAEELTAMNLDGTDGESDEAVIADSPRLPLVKTAQHDSSPTSSSTSLAEFDLQKAGNSSNSLPKLELSMSQPSFVTDSKLRQTDLWHHCKFRGGICIKNSGNCKSRATPDIAYNPRQTDLAHFQKLSLKADKDISHSDRTPSSEHQKILQEELQSNCREQSMNSQDSQSLGVSNDTNSCNIVTLESIQGDLEARLSGIVPTPSMHASSNNRKQRFERHELSILSRYFRHAPKPSAQKKREFAIAFGVEVTMINNWFHKQRARQRQDKKAAYERQQEVAKGVDEGFSEPDPIEEFYAGTSIWSKHDNSSKESLRKIRTYASDAFHRSSGIGRKRDNSMGPENPDTSTLSPRPEKRLKESQFNQPPIDSKPPSSFSPPSLGKVDAEAEASAYLLELPQATPKGRQSPNLEYQYQGQSHESKSRASADSWDSVDDPTERRRIQNRIAQRKFRQNAKSRFEALEQERGKREGVEPPSPAASHADIDGEFTQSTLFSRQVLHSNKAPPTPETSYGRPVLDPEVISAQNPADVAFSYTFPKEGLSGSLLASSLLHPSYFTPPSTAVSPAIDEPHSEGWVPSTDQISTFSLPTLWLRVSETKGKANNFQFSHTTAADFLEER